MTPTAAHVATDEPAAEPKPKSTAKAAPSGTVNGSHGPDRDARFVGLV